MAEEISNKTLAVIVVAAIVVTLGSTALILRLGAPVITGMATSETGTATFNITGVTSIRITDASIDFGAGSVTPGEDYAVIDSDGLQANTSTWAATQDRFIVENDGNVNINISVASDEVASGFIGGTSPKFEWILDTAEGDSPGTCTDGLSTYADVTTTNQTFCNDLAFDTTVDAIAMDLRLTIPADASPGGSVATITFAATAT